MNFAYSETETVVYSDLEDGHNEFSWDSDKDKTQVTEGINTSSFDIYINLMKEKMNAENQIMMQKITAEDKLFKQKMKYENALDKQKSEISDLKSKILELEKDFIYRNLPPEAERASKVWLKAFRTSTGFTLDHESTISSINLIWNEWIKLKEKPPFYKYFLDKMFETRAKVGPFEFLHKTYLNLYEDPLITDKDLEWNENVKEEKDEKNEDEEGEKESEDSPDYQKNR